MKNASRPKNLVERVLLKNAEFYEMERSVLIDDHLKRYGAIRRFCYGKVLDCACGCGYGSSMVASNPDVRSVQGVDLDLEAIAWAKREFAHTKVRYEVGDATKVRGKFDTLVCLETIEHIRDTSVIPKLVERCSIDNVIVSFPDKKTTHYNPHHYHDFTVQEIIKLFPEHIVYHYIRLTDTSILFLTRKPKRAPAHLYSNLLDLRR